MNELKKILLNIVDEEEWTIRSFIAQEAIKAKYDIALFFKELDKLGCACWVIKSLMEYRDTYYFFNEHYREISDTLLANNDEEWFFFEWNDLPSSIVWCAVEKIAREMACDDLGLDS
jgi:hypothetical protein